MESLLHEEHRTPPFSELFMVNFFNGQKRANTQEQATHPLYLCMHGHVSAYVYTHVCMCLYVCLNTRKQKEN